MSTKKNKRKKMNQRKKRFVIGIILLISCCIVLTLLIKMKLTTEATYEIDSRIENIEENKKNDTEEYWTTGWLKVQGTNIDLPIYVFKSLETTPAVEIGNYAWDLSSEGKMINKVNIMSHNILNLSSSPLVNKKYFTKFEDLLSFVYYDFAKENRYIQYTVDNKDYLYKIYSVSFEPSWKVNLYKEGNRPKKEIKKLIEEYEENSIYNYDVEVNENDNLISLMTCTWFYGTKKHYTFTVNGRMVRENETIDDYKVEKSTNYKKVEKTLKGETEDEEA